MEKFLIARVIMWPNGTAHIALLDKQTVECSPNSLSELLSDPHEFIAKNQFKYTPTASTVNPQRLALENIKGLTLLKIYSDAEVVCIFPKLFHALFSHIQEESNQPLDFKKYVEGLEFSDEKHYLMKFFYDFTNESHSELTIRRKLGINFDVQSEIMLEAFNTSFSAKAPEEVQFYPSKNAAAEAENALFTTTDLPDTVSIQEFADMHNVASSTVYGWIRKGKLNEITLPNGEKRVNKNTPRPNDRRVGRAMPKWTETRKKDFSCKGSDYTTVQEYIKERGYVSDGLRPFIRTYDEMNYYIKNRYHEVLWNGKRALIIDINPEYYCERLGKTNRQLIMAGNSPVVPRNDEFEFIIHHIGQKINSPFAIIPGDDHKKYHSVFHIKVPKSTNQKPSEDLHDSNFELQKQYFWKKYLNEYDVCGNYQDIPYTSLRDKRNTNH